MAEKIDKSQPVSTNITWYEGKVSAADRRRVLRQESALPLAGFPGRDIGLMNSTTRSAIIIAFILISKVTSWRP
ncbi:MAG: hypothetical protein ACYCZR_09860 [Burkholderiales bacterium]